MRLPELVSCRNITYEEALRGEKARLKRMIFQARCTDEMARGKLKMVLAEIKRWPGSSQ